MSKFKFPAMETERLLLRTLTLEDRKEVFEVFELFSQEEVTRFMDIPPCKNILEAEEIIQFHLEDSGCRWGLFDKSNHKLLGTCGYHCWITGDEAKAEIGFDLSSDYWGQGFMTEAVQPVLRFGFNDMKLAMIEATVDPANDKSIRLLKRFGFHRKNELVDGLEYFYLKS